MNEYKETKTGNKILFILHSASHNGASVLMLHFLRWFKTNTDIPFQILVLDARRANAQLIPKFKKIAKVLIYQKETCGLVEKIFSYLRLRSLVYRIERHFLIRALNRSEFSLVYANATASGMILGPLLTPKCPVITYVHELEYSLRFLESQFEALKKYTHFYIADSEHVRKNLIDNRKIPQDRVDVVFGFVPSRIQDSIIMRRAQLRIRKELNIPQDALIVGACGFIRPYKGPDMFIHLAHNIYLNKPNFPVHFIWVGRGDDSHYTLCLEKNIKDFGLKGLVHFVGKKPDSLHYLNVFDVFALVSRVESCSLVMLEAASLGKPIVCFEDCGGPNEFVGDDCGFTSPYLDVEDMAEKVIELLKNTELRRRLGRQAQKKVQEMHDIEVAAPKILKIIRRFMQDEGCISKS